MSLLTFVTVTSWNSFLRKVWMRTVFSVFVRASGTLDTMFLNVNFQHREKHKCFSLYSPVWQISWIDGSQKANVPECEDVQSAIMWDRHDVYERAKTPVWSFGERPHWHITLTQEGPSLLSMLSDTHSETFKVLLSRASSGKETKFFQVSTLWEKTKEMFRCVMWTRLQTPSVWTNEHLPANS